MRPLLFVFIAFACTLTLVGCSKEEKANPEELLEGDVNTYQAEDENFTKLYGDAAIVYGKNHIGDRKVGWIGNGQGMVEFTFDRLKGGEYNLYVHYETGEDRPFMIQVNDQEAVEYIFPSLGTWDTVGVFQLTVTLQEGTNSILFFHDKEFSPDLDCISFEYSTRENISELEKDEGTTVYVERPIESDMYSENIEGITTLEPGNIFTYQNVTTSVEDYYLVEVFYKVSSASSIRLHYGNTVKYLTLSELGNTRFSSTATVLYMKEDISEFILSHQFGDSIEISMIKVSNLNTPAVDWGYKLSDKQVIPNNANIPVYPWYPDGHISVLPDGEGGYMMYWAEYKNYRTISDSVDPVLHYNKVPNEPIFGGRGNWDKYDNGGLWLMSVHRIDDTTLVGFYHAEDHWYPHETNDVAWKSIGVAYSYDNGISWEDEGLILTSNEDKPDDPVWGGIGDNCVVWDAKEERWVAVYQKNILRSAISEDPLGGPGTWYKYHQGEYTSEGIGGLDSPQPGLSLIPGGNPSIHFNYYLNKWVIVWHGWDPPHIYMSVSDDLINWEEPQILVPADGDWRRSWYPTIIGIDDTLGGKYVQIYYADLSKDFSDRKFTMIEVEFLRNSEVDED